MSPEPIQRPQATAADARAIGHPLRLRILRLCLDEPRTNKELADALGRDPGTVLHHVRTLLDNGFLEALEPRRGARGARERPYLATRRSWTLDFGGVEVEPSVAVAVAQAFTEELRDAIADMGEGALLAGSRLGPRLTAADLEELQTRLGALAEEFAARDQPQGEPVSLYMALHRRPR